MTTQPKDKTITPTTEELKKRVEDLEKELEEQRIAAHKAQCDNIVRNFIRDLKDENTDNYFVKELRKLM